MLPLSTIVALTPEPALPAATVFPSPEPAPGMQVYEDPVMGIRLSCPAGYRILEEKYLFSEYGFVVEDPGHQAGRVHRGTVLPRLSG